MSKRIVAWVNCGVGVICGSISIACSAADAPSSSAPVDGATSVDALQTGTAQIPNVLPEYVAINATAESTLNLVARLYFPGKVVEWYEPAPGAILLSEAGIAQTQVAATNLGLRGLTMTELFVRLSGGGVVPDSLRLAEERAIALNGRDSVVLGSMLAKAHGKDAAANNSHLPATETDSPLEGGERTCPIA